MYWLMCSKHINYHKIEVIWARRIFSSTNCFPINVDRTSFFCKLSLPRFSVTSIMDVIYGSIICQLSEPLRRSSIPIKQYFYLTNFWQSCQFICMCSRAATIDFWQASHHSRHFAEGPPLSIFQNPEGVSSTMFFTSNDKNIYLKMWIFFDIWCGKRFAISIGQIQPKLIYGLVTYGPNGL